MDKQEEGDNSRATDVNLSPELERMVQERVASGLSNREGEALRDALRLLLGQDLARLRGALAEGLSQADKGDLLDGAAVTRELSERLRLPRAHQEG